MQRSAFSVFAYGFAGHSWPPSPTLPPKSSPQTWGEDRGGGPDLGHKEGGLIKQAVLRAVQVAVLLTVLLTVPCSASAAQGAQYCLKRAPECGLSGHTVESCPWVLSYLPLFKVRKLVCLPWLTLALGYNSAFREELWLHRPEIDKWRRAHWPSWLQHSALGSQSDLHVEALVFAPGSLPLLKVSQQVGGTSFATYVQLDVQRLRFGQAMPFVAPVALDCQGRSCVLAEQSSLSDSRDCRGRSCILAGLSARGKKNSLAYYSEQKDSLTSLRWPSWLPAYKVFQGQRPLTFLASTDAPFIIFQSHLPKKNHKLRRLFVAFDSDKSTFGPPLVLHDLVRVGCHKDFCFLIGVDEKRFDSFHVYSLTSGKATRIYWPEWMPRIDSSFFRQGKQFEQFVAIKPYLLAEVKIHKELRQDRRSLFIPFDSDKLDVKRPISIKGEISEQAIQVISANEALVLTRYEQDLDASGVEALLFRLTSRSKELLFSWKLKLSETHLTLGVSASGKSAILKACQSNQGTSCRTTRVAY